MSKNASYESPVVIVGSGLAGLSAALRLADRGIRSIVLTKRSLDEGSSLYAQGGIAAVTSETDSFDAHVEDTLDAGAGLCHPDAVQYTVTHAPAAIDWLTANGVAFSLQEGEARRLHLTREGGHSHRRVVHTADATGRAVVETLDQEVRANPLITVIEHLIAVDLVTTQKLGANGPNRVVGLYALDLDQHLVSVVSSSQIILATGGASKVYLYTSNPDTSTGDGIAMAWRAGCRVANMEFVQFHPTCLFHPHAKSFLISEAVRGEGGRLLLDDGSPFMAQHDSRAELAPRDIVARAIDFEMKRSGSDCVYLDISHRPKDFITEHFPTIFETCLHHGIDIAKEPIPVVPAAHYTCGGVVVDQKGKTDIGGLYAIGECTFTGLHGANRLASNSLLECLVYSDSAVTAISESLAAPSSDEITIPPWDESRVTDPDEMVVVSHNWDELRRFMWDYVGIVRTTKRLQRAAHRLRLLDAEIREFYSNFRIDNDLVELRNLVVVAELIVRCALMRRESRGLHYMLDYPDRLSEEDATDSVLSPDLYAENEGQAKE